MTDQKLWREIQKRITKRKSKKLTMKELRDKLTAEKESDDRCTVAQLEAMVQKRVEQGKLHHANDYLFLPDEAPPWGGPEAPGRKKKQKPPDPRQGSLL